MSKPNLKSTPDPENSNPDFWPKAAENSRRFGKTAGSFLRSLPHSPLRVALCTFVVLALYFLAVIWNLPEIDQKDSFVIDETTLILDRSGTQTLYTVHDEKDRQPIALSEISPNVIFAVLAAEDDRFFNHGGYDMRGILKAACYEFGSLLRISSIEKICPQRGGSTVTQQLAKNVLLTSDKTLTRKVRELVLAQRIEKQYAKEEILEMYLNTVPFGSDLYGISTTSEAFFGKPPVNLTISEAAILAAVIQRPSYFSPWDQNAKSHLNLSADILEANDIDSFEKLENFSSYGWQYGLIGQNVQLAKNETVYFPGRADWVLGRMLDLNFISEKQYRASRRELIGMDFEQNHTPILAPHFVMMVRQELEDRFGPELVQKGGLKVFTSLDFEKQRLAESAIKKWLPELSEKYQANNAALTALDPQTGEILAMVGSADFWNEEINGQVNVNLGYRSAASTFKPIIYAANFAAGLMNAESKILDMPTAFGNWRPKNFDGRFRGDVTVRQALGNSLNIPAVKAFLNVGIDEVYEMAQKLGINFLHEADFYGPTMALGSADIRPLDLVTAYSVFANEGQEVRPVTILKVEDRFGNILFEQKPLTHPKQLLTPEVAAEMTSILSDPKARGIGWNAYLQLKDRPNAIKTGTSSRRIGSKIYTADLWSVGYTPEIAAVIWVGNTSGQVLSEKASGLLTAASIWKDFMTQALKNAPVRSFAVEPSGEFKI